MIRPNLLFCIALVVLRGWCCQSSAENWPRWRGPNGNAVSSESGLPIDWSRTKNIAWKASVPGEGASSPIVWDDSIFLTSALDEGTRRAVHHFDRKTGRLVWSREVFDENPELSSVLTGHAAATPVTDGQHVVVFFGNAGAVCYDFSGKRLWQRRFGEFDSELGLASSPILYEDRVILVCDHDGNRFTTFDSFITALDLATGHVVWKTDRPKLFRSWSTPILVKSVGGNTELVVNAQDELRGYDPGSGRHVWNIRGMTGWVTPSPVSGKGLVFATSGKDGPTMAIRPGGTGDVTESNIVWQHKRGAPYVCSPLLLGDQLYVHNEQGVLSCYEAATGNSTYQHRLGGKFYGSSVGAEGRIYITNEEGTTHVVKAGREFHLLASCPLEEECLASPAISHGSIFIRTRFHLFCISQQQ